MLFLTGEWAPEGQAFEFVGMYVCRQKSLMFTALLLKDSHQIALVVQFYSLKNAYKVGRVFCHVLWSCLSNSCNIN